MGHILPSAFPTYPALQLTLKTPFCLNSFASLLAGELAGLPGHGSLELAGSGGEGHNYLSSAESGECALPKGSPSSAMALMRLLARTCTCFPLVRL